MSTQPQDGQLLDSRPNQPTSAPAFVAASVLYNLINDAAAADTSPAVDVIGFSRGALEVTGNGGTFSIQLEGSCSEDNPDATGAAWSNLGSAVVAAGITILLFPGVRWIRAVMTGPVSGNINVNLSAVAP